MEMASAPVLKPCPFCGERPRAALRFNVSSMEDVKVIASVGCEACEIRMTVGQMAYAGVGIGFDQAAEMCADAIRMWNRRDGHDDCGD